MKPCATTDLDVQRKARAPTSAQSCSECVRALQLVVHASYREGCLGCGVRKLAYMDGESRQKQLDRIQFVCGFDVRREATQMLREECARIEALKQRQSGRIVA